MESQQSDGPPKRRNLNLDAAYLHILGDLIMAVGVLIASILIYINPEWKIADPICTFLFAGIVFYTATKILRKCFVIFMEGTPPDVVTAHLLKDLR